ncbi:MAG: polysaccharide biosynthesis tyrosine autokinase [Candidatus Cryptobacteroides sp.]|nr:polysaccharide biosynthesis tyrosine autokinase [Candidatus Cryptobacteroides sp.]
MQTNSTNGRNDQDVNIIDILMFLLSKWKWFVISIIVFGGLAWFQYARTPKTYFRSATVIIKDPSNKISSAGLDRYDNYINKVNVANEILQFRSKKLMRDVVSRMSADIDYKVKEGLQMTELYKKSPVSVRFLETTPEMHLNMVVTPLDSSKVMVSDFGSDESDKKWTVPMKDTVNIEGVKLVVAPTNYYTDSWKGEHIHITKNPMSSVVGYFISSLGIRQEEDEASILTLSLKDRSAARAEDVLNMLISVYNEEAINDKNQVAINTAEFINERLIIIESELGGVESHLESFKRENRIVDIATTAGMYVGESQKYNTNVMELETQLRLATYIKDYLTDPTREIDLIPANTGISDMNIESQIAQYNTIKLRRDKLIEDSSEKNPVVEELNTSLRAMKQSIIRAVDNMIVSINVRRNDAQSRESQAQSRVSSIPTKERQMLSIERQQKIKESLYLFLLNKREENALSQAMVDNNARVIDGASGPNAPIAPNRNKIMLLGLLLGLAFPGVIFLMIMFLDTRIRTKKDIQGKVTAPFLGVIPEQDKENENLISEAFKIVRTNMSFLSRKDRKIQVIMCTSFSSGDGKTFVSLNLANSFISARKKVVLVDLDIRKGILTAHFSKHSHHHAQGVTNYLADTDIRLDDIISSDTGVEGLDLIPSGSIAPNPAELLMDERLDEMFKELRNRYDVIITDSVPVGLVADATIANRVTDLTLFVVRAGRLDRRQLPDIEAMYQERKLTNMSLLLNGADFHHHGYGYGYGYGYGHGYGYGYGYGYVDGKKKKRQTRK